MGRDNNDIDLKRDEEYILLHLDSVCGQVDIPANEPYTLSGLDTLNPILTIGGKLKLIGEYDETVGTCLIFSEEEKPNLVNEETGSSETPAKQIKHVTSLHKVLRFRLLPEADDEEQQSSPKSSLQQENPIIVN